MISIKQIYFSDKTLVNCYDCDFIMPYFNEVCTAHFENSVIVKLIEEEAHKAEPYFGVWSHRHSQKHRNFDPKILPEIIANSDCDIVSFFSKQNKKGIVSTRVPRLYSNFKTLIKLLGYADNNPNSHYILFNHFISRSEIYEEFVYNVLKPAISLIETHPELSEVRKPYVYGASTIRFRENPKLSRDIGKYTMSPFLLEWLAGWWFKKMDFKLVQL